MKKFVTYLTTYNGTVLPPYYIGSTTEEKIISGNYFGSPRSKKWKKIFKQELKDNKNLFKIEILSYHDNRIEALNEELNLQIFYNVVKSSDFFNESLACPNGFFGRDISGILHPMFGKHHLQSSKDKMSSTRIGMELSAITIEKIRLKNLGRICSDEAKIKISAKHTGHKYNVGSKRSEETKKKMSENNIGEKNPFYNKQHTEEAKKKIKESGIGRGKGEKRSDEVKKKIASSLIGRKLSEETKKKMSENRKPIAKNLCIHCNRSIDPGNFKQYHGEKCKFNLRLEAPFQV